MALGARPADVLCLVIRQRLSLVAGGLIVGFALSLAASRGIAAVSVFGSSMDTSTNLLGTRATDPVIYMGAALFLSTVALLATWIPARRAACVEPSNQRPPFATTNACGEGMRNGNHKPG